mgnify:CR=1 FL=1
MAELLVAKTMARVLLLGENLSLALQVVWSAPADYLAPGRKQLVGIRKERSRIDGD